MRLSQMIRSGMLFSLMVLVATQLQAQFDDLYYVPSKDRASLTSRTGTLSKNSASYNTFDDYDSYENYSSRQSSFDNAEFDYDDFHFSSRINRFHRVNPGFGFYDPFFMDPFYMDPFMYNRMAFMNPWMMRPGFHMSFGWGMGPAWGMGPGWGWNRWNRWNSWGCPSWGWGGNQFGMGYAMGFNQGFGMGMGMGMNPWNPYGFGMDPFFPGGGVFVNNTVVNNNVAYGPRRGGAVTSTDRATPRTGKLAEDGTNVRNGAAAGVTREGATGPSDGISSRSNTRNVTETPTTRTQNIERNSVSRVGSDATRGGEYTAANTRRYFEVERADRNSPTRSNAVTPADPSARRSPVTSPSRNNVPQREMTPSRSATPQRSTSPQRSTAPANRGTMSPQRNAPSRSNDGFNSSPRSNNRYDSAPSRTAPSRGTFNSPPSRSSSPSSSPSFDRGSSSPSRMSPSSGGGSMSPSRSSGGSSSPAPRSSGGGRRG